MFDSTSTRMPSLIAAALAVGLFVPGTAFADAGVDAGSPDAGGTAPDVGTTDAGSPSASGPVPARVPIHAYLTDSEGVPVDGETQVRLSLYAEKDSPSALHVETQTVQADGGVISTHLGKNKELDLSIFRNNATLYLGLAVGDGAEMDPRLRIGTAPYAAVAGRAANADKLRGKTPDDFAPADFQPSWDDVQNKPTRAERGYTAQSPIVIDGNKIGLTDKCSAEQVLTWDGSSWTCADAGSSYTGKGPVEVDNNASEISLTSNCGQSNVLKWDGSNWTCSSDQDTTYIAGSGLNRTSNRFSVDTSKIQSRVTGTCGSGEYIKAVR
ncbi:MAG: hypothetical protein ABEL76_14105, partial [Bradymonadaceae bacterium]